MNFWKNKIVTVTGANGFTGSHLCRELLKEGAKVKALVKEKSSLLNLLDIRDKISICYGDITNFDHTLEILEGIDYVFNPAAIVPVMHARKSPQKSFFVNGIGAFNVAYASIKTSVKKILHISTCHVYGNLPNEYLPINENAIPLPGDLYAASKYAAEIYLQPLIKEGAPIVISRAFAKYGPGQGTQYLIPRIITQLLSNQTPRLGSPKPTRDYSYIVDIVRGYMTILEKGRTGEIYHLSSEQEMSVGEVYELISGLIGKNINPIWDHESRPQDILRLFGNSQKARQQLDWRPQISLKEGLIQTINWFNQQLESQKLILH